MRHSNLKKSLQFAMLIALAAGLSNTSLAQIQDSPAAQAPATQPATAGQAQPAGAPQLCGNQPLCYESADFAATITHFRTSVLNNYHVIDVTMRFQNKTQQQLILGYVVSSGIATDDRGNRAIVGGANGYHGIGLVAGGNFDPKFVVRPAGFGDAQFELVLQGWPQVIGFTYALDLSVAEVNTFEGNQHTLGEEYPIHFDGLRNGAGAASPMFVGGSSLGYAGNGISNPASAMSNPCSAAGSLGQGAGQAASTVSNAANAISNLGSMFRHKKTQDAGQAAANAAGCDPNAAVGMPGPGATTNSAGVVPKTGSTNPLQQAVSRTVSPQPAVPNPLNPLASPPAQTKTVLGAQTSQAPATKGAVANPYARVAIAQNASTAPVKPNPAAAKPQPAPAAAKPSPAKTNTKAQPQRQQLGNGN